MKNVLGTYFESVPRASVLLVALYAVGFPLAMAGLYTHAFDVYAWLAFSPALVWKGQVWRLMTYPFLANGIVDWVVSLFWLATLVAVLGRNWSWRELWAFCMVATVVGALTVVLALPSMRTGVAGNAAMIFGLLAAWYRLYGRERLILLGLGEVSVRQVAVLVGFIELLITGFGLGWLVTLAMMGGGAVAWLTLVIRGRTALNRRSLVVSSQRMAKLEL